MDVFGEGFEELNGFCFDKMKVGESFTFLFFLTSKDAFVEEIDTNAGFVGVSLGVAG